MECILGVMGGGANPKPMRLHRGVYVSSHFSFENYLRKLARGFWDLKRSDEAHFWIRADVQTDDGDTFDCFGVCDSPEQFFNHKIGKLIETDHGKYVVSFTKIDKGGQPPKGGWRWHKWGKYIGEKNPKFEYIYDEGPEIQEAHCYQIFMSPHEDAHLPLDTPEESVNISQV